MDSVPHGGIFVRHERAHEVAAHEHQAHSDHRLAYLVDGAIELHVNGRFVAGPGSLVVLPAGSPHRNLGGSRAELWLAGFCSGCVGLADDHRLMLPFRQVRYGALPVRVIPPDRRPRVLRLFHDLRDEADRGDPESLDLLRSLVTLLLGEALRAGGRAPGGGSNPLVADALEFIHARALHPISLRDVARAVARSPAHVATTVKRHTGHTVGDWIRSVRVSQAASLLVHTDEALDAIAERVGWSDTTHFIRQFRKEYGITPAAWRRTARSDHTAGIVEDGDDRPG